MESHSAATEHANGFRNPSTLTNWTKGLLYASIPIGLGWTWTDWSAYQALVQGNAASEWPTWLFVVILPVAFAIPISVLTWIHRANYNARALGAAGLRFTPGWAVGWYFVPIAFFWKPLQAMLEIWRASSAPEEWRRQPGSPLLGWWWALWLVPFFVGEAVALVARRFEMVSDPDAFEAVIGLGTGLIDIPLTLILIAIIARVHRMQMKHYRRQLAAA